MRNKKKKKTMASIIFIVGLLDIKKKEKNKKLVTVTRKFLV